MADVCFCGIDLGTTNTKAVLVDNAGKCLDSVSMLTGCDQKPDLYGLFARIMQSFSSKRSIADSQIVCSITAQGGSFALLDEKYQPMSRLYSWTESSANPAVDSMIQCFGKENYYRITGWPPNAWLMSSKIKELFSTNQFGNAAYVATLPEILHARFFGRFVTDITNAQITGLCDFQMGQWDPAILNWVGIPETRLPEIESELTILADNIQTEWGSLCFATSSHDQYAAMEAAHLAPHTNLMLATGTAWVINIRTEKPIFDDAHVLSHPGRDIRKNEFGNIITLGPIGRGLEMLLKNFGVDYPYLNSIESSLPELSPPSAAIDVDMDHGRVRAVDSFPLAVKRYMEWSAAQTLFLLELYDYRQGLNRIVMTGGAGASRYWPQVIADITQAEVQVFDFPAFTAYGAALHARAAYTDRRGCESFFQEAKTTRFFPHDSDIYRDWYEKYQKPYWKRELTTRNTN